MGNGLISIICPVFNSELLLEECILSVLNQTDKNWELILIDDGSRDKSGIICDGFSKSDSRIKTIHKDNNGQMKARIDGIKQSLGDYIIFLDSDDLLESNAVETLREQFKLYPKYDCFLFNATVFQTLINSKKLPHIDHNIVLETNDEIIQYTFGDQMFGYLWMYCFKKDLLQKAINERNEFLSIRYTEDGAFLYNVLSYTKKAYTLATSLYLYRNNEVSITHNLTDKDRRDRFLVFNSIYKGIYSKHDSFDLDNNLAVTVVWSMFSYLEHIGDRNVFKKIFKECRNSFLSKIIMKKCKSSNRRFKIYTILISLNLPRIFYNFSHK